MKDWAELIGIVGLCALMVVGAILFIALFFGSIFGSIAGVAYLFIKGIVGLFS